MNACQCLEVAITSRQLAQPTGSPEAATQEYTNLAKYVFTKYLLAINSPEVPEGRLDTWLIAV